MATKITLEAGSLAELIQLCQQISGMYAGEDSEQSSSTAAGGEQPNGEPAKATRRRRTPTPPPPAQAADPTQAPSSVASPAAQTVQQPTAAPFAAAAPPVNAAPPPPPPPAFQPAPPPPAAAPPQFTPPGLNSGAPAARPLVIQALEAIDRLASVHGVESVYNWAITRALQMPPTVTAEQFRTTVIHTLTDDQLAGLIKAASAS